jgi:hypothetical protein
MARTAWRMSASMAGVMLMLGGCQPGEERREVDPAAIPAAPDMRPGTEAVPGGVVVPGAVPDTAPRLPADTLAPGSPPAVPGSI